MSTLYSTTLRHASLVALVLLVAASVVLTLGFACAVPFVGFAAMAAVLFDRKMAAATMLGVWLVNQVIGFGLMAYPLDAMTLGWGMALGVIAVATSLAASAMLQRFSGLAGYAAALCLGFFVYQGLIVAYGSAVHEDLGWMDVDSLGRIFAINVASFGVFLGVHSLLKNTAFGRSLQAAHSLTHA